VCGVNEIENIIEKLGDIATYDSSVGGFHYGSPPSLEVRIEAVHSLGTYVPHPKAVEVFTKIIDSDWLKQEISIAAALALRNK